ncbi:DNA repair exonuclease [Rhodopirellula sp. JC740]|uniref:DNA repair exonuclease n=1 Tax=Rhodopirellula halodulae TaxID=2894198 RepID=A0ABS8NJ17_9BACT|nr:DNA repair exonuclease [Rhodopirellula sp. JC740]MCC9643549.1 DNA repair exonuclease [Rhodopirellula sp. JC740]
MSHRRILHAADIHLDSPLQKLDAYEDAPVDEIREASRRALQNMTRVAIEEQVDLVVIAGDLYDGDWPDQNTGLFFVAQATRLIREGIHVAVIRGNHDAANKMTSNLPLPKNPDGSEILLSEKKVDQRILEDLGIAIHGRSYAKRAETGDMAGEYPQPIGGMFNLALLHTGLSGLEGHDPYAPCSPQQLADKGYDYWALGHIHQRGEHQIDGAAPVVFSGNVQGRHIRESGPKGCILVDIDDRNQTTRRFVPLDVVRFESFEADASDWSHTDELMDAYEDWLSEQLTQVDDRLLVTRVVLSGESSLHHQWMREQANLEAGLRAASVTHGHGQVWLERLKVRTTAERSKASAERSQAFAERPQSTVSSTDSPSDGPIQSILAVVEQLKTEGGDLDWMDEEISPLLKKLPVEFSGDQSLVRLDDQNERHEWIDAATAELMARLQGGER